MPETRENDMKYHRIATIQMEDAGSTEFDVKGKKRGFKLIDVLIVWGDKEGDRYEDTFVAHKEVMTAIKAIRDATPGNTKEWSDVLFNLRMCHYLDYRYGVCYLDKCDRPIRTPGLDASICPVCGYVSPPLKASADRFVVTQTKKRKKKGEEAPPIPMEALPLFVGEEEALAAVQPERVLQGVS